MTEQGRIQSLLDTYGLSPKKSFGQNFLINEGILNRIVKGRNVDSFDTVIEIGPGLGSRTTRIQPFAKKLICVDADRDRVAVLKDLFKDKENTTIINSDFLRFDPDTCSKKESRLRMGNLPYNITSELLNYRLEKGFQSAGVMVQKEVADKLIYKPDKKTDTPLGAYLKRTSEVNVLTFVDRSCFNPVPKVDSAFIRIDHKKDVTIRALSILTALFRDPNKTRNNCLKNVYGKDFPLCLSEDTRNRLSYRARQLTADELEKICLDVDHHIVR